MTLNELHLAVAQLVHQHPEQGDEEIGVSIDGDVVSFGKLMSIEFEDLTADQVEDSDCEGPAIFIDLG
jgi:hypothetical protein